MPNSTLKDNRELLNNNSENILVLDNETILEVSNYFQDKVGEILDYTDDEKKQIDKLMRDVNIVDQMIERRKKIYASLQY
jgi:hypothetical protein